MPDFHAIGLDVAGTKIAGGWVSFPHGTIHARRVLPTAWIKAVDMVIPFP